MPVELRPLREVDVAPHNAGEDELTIRYLNGAPSTTESTRAAFEQLAHNAAEGRGKRGFGVWLDGRLAGYVDCDPDNDDGLQPGEVNLSYAVHPWARRQGVATAAVALICDVVRANSIGSRAAIRVEAENVASVRVAEKAGFVHVRDFVSGTDIHDGSPVTLSLYLRPL